MAEEKQPPEPKPEMLVVPTSWEAIALHESGCGSAPRRRESSVEEESTRRVVD